MGSAASSTVGGESLFQDPSLERLQQAFNKEFEPGTESSDKFAKRLRRVSDALQLFGEEVDEEKVERRIIRALYEDKIQGQNVGEQLAFLKESFQDLVLDEAPKDKKQSTRCV
eukprot:s2077_g22.t1